jgi:hypothetical protein
LQRFAEPPVTLINTADRVPMPLRSIAWLCAVILILSGGATRAAAPDGARWQAVLVAGDIAEPVFDNAVAAFGQWLAVRGVVPRDIHRLSARPFDPATEAASAPQLLRRIALLSPRPGDRCLIFVTSHGEHGRGVHLAYSGERLTPAALAQALSAGCGTVPTVVIVSSCYSGSFAVGPMLAAHPLAARPTAPTRCSTNVCSPPCRGHCGGRACSRRASPACASASGRWGSCRRSRAISLASGCAT